MRLCPLFFLVVLFLSMVFELTDEPKAPFLDPLSHFNKTPLIQRVSVEDLKNSEKYLRNDLGLEESPGNSNDPLWKRSLKTHPFLVWTSGIFFAGGLIAFIIVFRGQNRRLRDGLEKFYQNESSPLGVFAGPRQLPNQVQELIDKESNDIFEQPTFSPEKALRKVDNVLDTLRHAVGSGMRKSRLSLFVYIEKEAQFRICGFSQGEEFNNLSPAIPPEDVAKRPLRTLSLIHKRPMFEGSPGWCFPFVSDTGQYCVLFLEMESGQPPEIWSEYVQGSMDLIKALIARQELLQDDASLLTRDPFGSLDYRASMNRLLEEWKKTERLQIPFSVIAIRVENFDEIEKYYGTLIMEKAWTRFTEVLKSIIRPTDWIMRPQKDLLIIQVLEAGSSEGRAVSGRITKNLTRFGHSGKLEKGIRYRGVMLPHAPGESSSVSIFLEQILQTLEKKSDFDGTFFYT